MNVPKLFMNKIVLFLFFQLLIGAHAWSLPSDTSIPQLKVGVIAPLTGGVASWGLSVRTAIEIANKRSDTPAKLFFQDEGTCVPQQALSAYQYLRSIEKVDVIVASCLEGAQAVAPLARRDKIPFFISGRSSLEFQEKNGNALSWLALLDSEGKAVADFVKEKGWKKGSAMVWSGYFGVQFAQGIQKALQEGKNTFEFEVMEVDQGSSPTGAEVQRLIRGKPDVLFLMMSEPAAAYIVKQLRTLRYEGKIILQSSMLQTYNPAVRKDFIGVLQQKFPVDPKQFQEIQQEIETTLGSEVADDFVFSYDGFSVLLKEARSCQSNAATGLEECLSTQMRNAQWREGASGSFRFMKNGSTERPMIFKTITEKGFE